MGTVSHLAWIEKVLPLLIHENGLKKNFDMKAPDKIYLHGYEFDDEPCKTWEREPKVKGMRGYPAKHAEYISKDLLLEWAEAHKVNCIGDHYTDGRNDAMDLLIKMLDLL